MNYYIHITQTAERDMISAADYIEFTLKNPEAPDRRRFLFPCTFSFGKFQVELCLSIRSLQASRF